MRARLLAVVFVSLLAPAAAHAPEDVPGAPVPAWRQALSSRTSIESGLTPQPMGYTPGQGPLEFVCAKPTDSSERGNWGSANAVYTCPIRVYDFVPGGNRASPFGNIRMAVHDGDPAQSSFFSLHGFQESAGPTNRSREGNTHTTFSTPDMGISWTDSWTNGCPESRHGEAAAGSMDPQGLVTQAYLWHTENASLVHAWWLGPVEEAPYFMDSYCGGDGFVLRTGHRVGALDLETVTSEPPAPPEWLEAPNGTGYPPGPEPSPSPDPSPSPETSPSPEAPPSPEAFRSPRNVPNPEDFRSPGTATSLPNGRPDPSRRAELPGLGASAVRLPAHLAEEGEAPDLPPPGTILDVLTWQEGTRLRFAVGDRWATSANGTHGTWNVSAAEVPGCIAASDTVAWDGRVYVACSVGEGYEGRRRYQAGDIDLWAFDPFAGTAELLSRIPVHGGNVRLAVTDDGYFAAVATTRRSESDVAVEVAFGWHGKTWDPATRDLGDILHGMMGGLPVRSAHATALAFASDSKTLFMVYHEWNRQDQGPELPPLAPPDPEAPPPRLTDHQKLIVTLDACTAPITASLLVLGTSPDVFQLDPASSSMFDDLSDGLETARMPSGEEWVFFAVNDYGAAQFGAVRAGSGGAGAVCPVLPPLPPPPPAIFPQAVASVSPAMTAVASVVGVVTMAMVAYLVAVKRRATNTVAAEDK